MSGLNVDNLIVAAVHTIGNYKDERLKIRKIDEYDGPTEWIVNLCDDRCVYRETSWHGVVEFHPGAWCNYITPIAEERRQAAVAGAAAQKAADEAEEQSKFTPVDDAEIFDGASDEPNPDRFYKWIVEVEANEIWVADGFNVTNDRAKNWLETDLGYSTSVETKVRVIHAPPKAAIAKAQGYRSIEDWEAANKANA